MLKIRRVHIVNAGYEEATFDGETFDFRDPDEVLPAHCVLHAENGTGKTTALGLIFNLPVPKESRFLPHLVKPDYEFADYFPRGVGIVAIEWHDPAGRHPVTLQFVVPQLKASERQTWRRWALFRAAPGLAFDDLPIKGLAGGPRTAFTGRDDVALWLSEHEARFADSHDFEAAAAQDAWRRILERHGIDTLLMDSQLEFNRQEGGLDAFLKIPTEEEFITRFLALCLVAPDQPSDGMVEPVCAQVRAVVARMTGYDALIAKRGLLYDLTHAFQPFADVARAWQERRMALIRAETHAAAIRMAAADRAALLEGQAEVADQAAQMHGRRQTELTERVRQGELTVAAARLLLTEMAAQAAVDEREAAVATAATARRRRAWMAAARDMGEILAIEAEIGGYAQALDAAERAVAEPRSRAHAAGATLAALLDQAVAAHRQATDREHAVAAAAQADQRDSQAGLKRIAAEMLATQREDAALEAKIEAADSALRRLLADGVIRPAEQIGTAMTRWTAELEEAERAARDAAGRAAQHDAATDAAAAEAGDAEAARREAAAQSDAERGQVEAAGRKRDELVAGGAWREQLGAAVAFAPEAAAMAQQRARDRNDEARREHGQADLLRRDADHIARHRVAAVDRNVDLVMERLEELGLRSTIAAAGWLADVVGDADRLRAYAAQDPAAFAGVFVQDPAELARVPLLDLGGLPLDRPVAMLAPAECPQTAMTLLVAVPDRAEAYDITAAEALVDDLGRKVEAAESAARVAAAAADILASLKAAIDAWFADWGGGRLELHQERIVELDAVASAAAIRAQAAQQRAEVERRAAAAARSEAQTQARRALAAEQAGMAAKRWQRDQGDALPGWRDRRSGLAAQLEALAEQTSHEQARGDAARERAEQARLALYDLKRHVADLLGEGERIEFRAAIPAEPLPTLDDARARYRSSAEVLRRAMEDRLGPLQGLLSAKREELDKRTGALRRVHGALADDRTALAVEARAPGLEERLATADAAERHATEAVGRAKGEADRAEAAAARQRASFTTFGAAGREVIAALTGRTASDLQAVLVAEEQIRREAEVGIAHAAAAADGARERARRAAGDAARLRDRAEPLPDRPGMPVELPESLGEALAAIDGARQRLEAEAEARRRCEVDLAASYDKFRRAARGHPDRPLEAVLVDHLIANEPEPAAEHAERLQAMLGDRIATLQQEIDEHEADKNRAVGEMDGLLLSAVGLFQRAVNRGVVPDSVPRFGGRRILTMSFRPPAADGEAGAALRRNVCERALIDYVAAGEVPLTDHGMAAALLEAYARVVHPRQPGEPALGLRLLKSNDQGRIHHLPVAAFKASGGETLTSAMLLYLLVARLRSEGRASQRARIGGVLILDNPLGKASNTLFLKMQLALAQAMDVQLIFTTAIKDWAAIGEFPQVVKLRKESIDPATGRIFVKATHQWIGFPELAASQVGAEAAQ